MTELENVAVQKPDIKVIYDRIEPKSRVLDLGCGDGSLLELLRERKDCKIQGIDRDQESVMKCIGRGVPVIQMDLDAGLCQFQDASFDYVILGLTFQQIRSPHKLLKEMCRVGRYSVCSVFNLGHWPSRLQFFMSGIMPMSKRLPYQWYNTPNIHLGTFEDFRKMCEIEDFTINRFEALSKAPEFLSETFPNIFAEIAVFTIEGRR